MSMYYNVYLYVEMFFIIRMVRWCRATGERELKISTILSRINVHMHVPNTGKRRMLWIR